jgi:hypothetical protein
LEPRNRLSATEWVAYHGNVYEDITAVLYSLIVLLSVELNPDRTISPSVNNQEKFLTFGLRFAFKR